MTKSRGIGKGRNNPHIGELLAFSLAARDSTPHLSGETPEEYRKRSLVRYEKGHPVRVLLQHRSYTQKIKMEVLLHYSLANEPECVSCGINDIDVLCLDHVDNNGTQHRKELRREGSSYYGWIIKNNYPDGFQVLCANCNLKKRIETQRAKDAEFISSNS